jgi:hypothetical protein
MSMDGVDAAILMTDGEAIALSPAPVPDHAKERAAPPVADACTSRTAARPGVLAEAERIVTRRMSQRSSGDGRGDAPPWS